MLTSVATWSLLVIAVLVAVGGVMGFVKGKSKVSLISGLFSAGAYGEAFMLSQGSPKGGLPLGMAISVVLIGVFAMRLKKTGKFMPAGMMLVCCGIELVVLALGMFL